MEPRKDADDDATPPTSQNTPVAVVGLGASAGGLEALETFFARMRSDAGVAFVVVPHLSPDFKSLMDELLARHTQMRVHRVENGMPVERDSIYVIPPKKEMIISGNRLLLRDKDPHAPLPLPIDVFFRSLASDLRQRAIAVVLSGTGSDGSRGIRDVHDAGGLVMVQRPESARFDGMPRAAIETGVVDLVLTPGEMPDAVLKYVEHARLSSASEPDRRAPEDNIERITHLLRSEYGIDFRHYKPNTFRRRIERRLLLNRAVDLDTYVQCLEDDKGELHSLYKDMLIGVTRFFRDRDAFERLATETIPQLVARMGPDDELRVWVPGCATGEEAYSLAILLHEQVTAARRSPESVKIFATDVHRASLEFAAQGVYDDRSVAEIGPVRLERYFRRVKDGYQVVQELRKLVVFAPHDVIKDAPFTRLDLISCRNLLIYFDALTQKKVISLFHFGLRTSGVLFLGASETPGDLAGEFEALDRHWKIFRKKRDVRLPADLRMPLGAIPAPQVRGRRLPTDAGTLESALRRTQDSMIQAFVPPSVLLDSRHEVVHTFSGGGRFLTQPADGRASLNILDLVEAELKLTINGALHRAAKDHQPVTYSGVRATTPDGPRRLRVSVRPFEQPAETFFLVTLEDDQTLTSDGPAGVDLDQMSRERIAALERELQYTRENLQATLEEMETANEELQATNEELVASNEELQSTNEELHSVNEELFTVNSEHQQKIRELTELTEDMENLFAATDVGTIFLDRELCVRKFTPQIARTFHLLPQDIGRRIDNFAHTLNLPELSERLGWVLTTEQRYEAQVADQKGSWYLLRVVPYRTDAGIQGVVVNLVDVTALKETERNLARMSKVFMDGADPIVIEDLSGRIVELNRAAERHYGYGREELIGQSIEVLIPGPFRERYRQLRERCRNQLEDVRNEESARQNRAGQVSPVLLTLSLLTDDDGKTAAIASSARDISRQKNAENAAHLAVQRRDEFLAMLSHELRNPLAAIQNASSLLMDARTSPELAQKSVATVHRQTTHMARLLEDLLDVSRVIQGKITLQLEPIDLAATAREAAEALQGLFAGRRQTLNLALPPRAVLVNGDRARLRQVQENLLANAAKYTPPGGRVTLSLDVEGTEAVVRVADTGRGIPRELLESIFELFTQGEEPLDRSQGGMGIGLTLVRYLVQLHGGAVQARSDGPGRGSEFEFRLPLLASGAGAERRDQPPPRVEPPPQHTRVLVLEDNLDAREVLEALLAQEGFEAQGFGDGESGLRAILADPPDAALVDIGLPGIDGYELARRVRQQLSGRRVILVALTGYGSGEDRRRVREAGFDAHLVKPAGRQEILNVLTQLLPTRAS